ncbi:CGLD27 family protein [Cyanobium sp. WAJ14-Wanaka]|uniref:CGLD27 family protein n=1 Tax=Cyanobium sp. WAJ14-Wanaka TaxID=2823725 RepID=UPI0020CD9535|nr:CGLD27 family protein [Cyanobium sp. WAJ14-Wanaka]MCP9774326.1 CGLD27 family protein [Cyanobium sp. WAJ14-Wanaka]
MNTVGHEQPNCPVPPEQRPLQEYEQLLASWFFIWPSRGLSGLLRALATSWLILLPITCLVTSGSWVLRHEPIKLVAIGAVAAILLPMLLLARQWLGWSYVHKRLVSEAVEYEESGWYDGQVWEKPLAWRQQDLLVAQHQVKPVLERLRQSAAMGAALMGLGAGLCQAL